MALWDKAFEFLVNTFGQSAVNYWRTRTAVDIVLTELREILPVARLLIERSECWRLPNSPIDELLSQLKYSVYEAESTVDELEYRRLKNKVEKSFPGTNFLRIWMSTYPTTVKMVLDRLNDDYNKLKGFCDIQEDPNQFRQIVRPTSRFETSIVYGLDEEFNEVICLMGVQSVGSGRSKRFKKLDIGESSSRMDEKWNVSFLSIVGMGGVGKTTVAQMVCKDKRVMLYFDLIMWVQVSNNFDLVRLTKEIIESATTKACNLPELDCNRNSLDALQVILQETLNSKRFLLVLDDVWSKDWHSLLGPMRGASEGSIVLVTTRSRDCVKIQGTSIDSRGVVNVEGLEKDVYWKFFKSRAFYSVAKSNNIDRELEVIGKEICAKLKGSPLAAKTIGDLLGSELNVSHWRNIKDSKMWELQTKEHDILPVLQLSYQYLPSHLKKCLSFCSLYPKNFKFTQSELTMCWIMQGLVKPLDDVQKLRTVPEGYFRDLVVECFFQKLKHGAYNENNEYVIHDEKDEYVIHDLMHDVCQSITRDECFCLQNGHSEQEVSIHIRHVSVFTNTLEGNELCKYKKLLSLKVASSNSSCITAIENWCNELTNIRSLSLARCTLEELPENIGNLKHLQFLDISGTNIETLPESFCSLYKLKYLNMNDCSNIQRFPRGFNNLVNLQLFWLPLEKVPLVEHFDNICKTIRLDNLHIVVPHQKIENLKNICKLSGSLTIEGLENVPSKNAAEEAHLNKKPLINRLNLVWSQLKRNEHQDKEVLHGLRPHSNLKQLRITNYFGKNLSPSWLKEVPFPNLEVHFEYCEFSTISYLPRFITKLIIRGCAHVTNFQNCLEPNHLSVLNHIQIEDCGELVSLPVESFGGFESLEWLKIASCPKLKSQNCMVLPPSLKGLELRSCGDLEESIPSCLQSLTSLETLSISNCQRLVSIPDEITSNLKSLSELCFEKCRKLKSLGGPQFLKSLQKVNIQGCPELYETRGRDIIEKLPSGNHILYRRSVAVNSTFHC